MKNLFIFLISISTIFLSCKKEYSLENPLADTVNWTNAIIPITTHPARVVLDGIRPIATSYSFANSLGTVIPLGTILVSIPTSCFVKMDNSSVAGNVDLKIIKATNFAQMIEYNLATVTNNSLLSTDGMLNLVATQGNDILKVAPGKNISLLFQRTSPNNFKGFIGNENNTLVNNITWSEQSNWSVDTLNYGTSQPGITYTKINVDSCHWINCDYFYNATNPTNIYLKLPTNYGNVNTITYGIIKTDKVLFGLFADVANIQFWQGSHYKVPIGKNIKLVAVSKKDNKIYYGSTDVTITANMTANITTMDEVTEAELQTRLNAL